MTKFVLSLNIFLCFCFTTSGTFLYAAEKTSIPSSIDNGTASSLSPEQIQQIIQNATPEQIEQIMEKQAPPKQRVAPYETIYKVEEPVQDELKEFEDTEEKPIEATEEKLIEDIEQKIDSW